MSKSWRTVVAGTVVALSGFSAFASVESSMASAIRACDAFNKMGVANEECKVSGSDFSIELRMDISGRSATDICKEAAESMKSVGFLFDQQWRLKIFSYFSDGKTLATCSLSR